MSAVYVETDAGVQLDGLATVPYGTPINDAELTVSIGERTRSGIITGVVAGTPNVVTAVAHGLANGDQVILTRVIGVTEAKGVYEVANVTTDTFELVDTAGTGTFINEGTPRWYRAVANAVDLPMSYVAASRGRYLAAFPATVVFAARGKYIAVIEATDFRLHIEHPFEARVWT